MPTKLRFINVNTLKILAAVFMVIDHIGLMLFPHTIILRIVGRMSFPLFAFAISEGCRYTRNKTKHFLLIALCALACQIFYYFFSDGSLQMCVFVTFAWSVLLIYAMQFFKKTLFDGSPLSRQILSALLFLSTVFGAHAFCEAFVVDYGFWGCMLPVFASVFDFQRIPAPEKTQKLDCLPLRVLLLGVGTLLMVISYLPVRLYFYAFLAIPLLLLYNGEKGSWRLKYFFYIFYPLHLAILQGIYWLIT